MIILGSTTDKLEIVTSSTADIDWLLSYVKLNLSGTPAVDDAKPLSGNSVTAQTINASGSPAASTDRWAITAVEIRNKHASASNDITVRHVLAGGTARELKKVTLKAGESLVRDKNGVWFHYDANLGVYSAQAIPMTRAVLTSGTGATYTTPAGCRAIDVEMVGGGGAGGGASSVASSGGGGGGGGAGSYCRKIISPPAASYTYTIGAGGAAGAAGANAGGNGGDTTFGGLTAKGGTGGGGCTSAVATRAPGGNGGVVGSGGDINAAGEAGDNGVNTTAALVVSGNGGTSELGGGANGVIAQGAGVAAVANSGGGGSGGASLSAGAAVAGGAGGTGVIVVTEYY